jgi:MFS family permease
MDQVTHTAVLPWYRGRTPAQRNALIAASLGWMLDSMDVMLFSMVLTYMMNDLAMSKVTAGMLGSVTLVASGAGGLMFGLFADRYGRTKALMASIAAYSVFTAACGIAQTVTQLTVFRVLLGLGMGGEWAAGAALVAETWPAEHRGKALGIVQSFWAVGQAAAAIVTALVLPVWGWRAVFFVGVAPALFTLWIRRSVEEPEAWRETRRVQPETARPEASRVSSMFRGKLGRLTLAISLMNAGTMFASWGFNLWIPAYLSLPASEGGIGLSVTTMSAFIVVMQGGRWLGYISYGFVSDAFGRKRTYVAYLVAAAALLPLYAVTRNTLFLLLLGPFVSFFGNGYFSGFGVVTAEIFPTEIRATAQGFTYNIGRVASAVAPFTVGALAETQGFGVAFGITAIAFVFSALMWMFIPETKGMAAGAFVEDNYGSTARN